MAREKNSPKTAKPVAPSARDGLYLATAREGGASWTEIEAATGAKSAIPLRVVLRRFLVSDEKNATLFPREFAKVAKLPATAKTVRELRDRDGAGFPLIAARTGLSVGAARALYVEAGGDSAVGRVYVGSAGRTLVVGAESKPLDPFAAKPAPKRAKRAAKAKPATAAAAKRRSAKAARAPRKAA